MKTYRMTMIVVSYKNIDPLIEGIVERSIIDIVSHSIRGMRTIYWNLDWHRIL